MQVRGIGKLGVFAIALSISGCDRREPVLSEQEIALLRETYPTMIEECIERARYEGFDGQAFPTDMCFEMEDERRWSGLWVNAFEGSRFCPQPAQTCPHDFGNEIWLSFATDRPDSVEAYGDDAVYAIEFRGRKTRYAGNFGHLDSAAQEIIVDRVISIEELEAN